MDKKTFAQFLLVSTIILAAWWAASYFIFRQPPGRQPGPGPVRRAEVAQPARAPEALETVQLAPPAAAEVQEEQPEPVEDLVLANELIRTEWTSRGASLQRLTILDERYKAPYKEGGERPPLVLLRGFQEGLYSDTVESVTFVGAGTPGQASSRVQVATADVVYELVEQADNRLVFETAVGDNLGHRLRIRKTVTIEPQGYHYDVALEFENVSQERYQFSCALRGAAGIEREGVETHFLGTRVGRMEGPGDYDITTVKTKTLDKKGPQTNKSTNITWAAVVNHYFAAVIALENPGWVSTVVSRSVTDTDILHLRGRWGLGTVRKQSDRPFLARQNAAVVVNTAQEPLKPNQKLAEHYSFIAAPKEEKTLARYDMGLSGLVEFGWFRTLSRLVLALLNAVHKVLPNYGVAILVLTAIMRASLHYLTRKSQLSFSKMQKLQPQIAELQKKYANDKQKQTQEQVELFRKYGVSPWKGCWPMLLQMPVLFALFGALRAAIQLRHAGFLWVEDLSRPDNLFELPFGVPLLGNQFNLLPILVIAVMLVNQRFTPKPATEQARQQQSIMKFMPVMLGLLFYRMPSGLCLYFVASMGIGALERWLIDKKAATIKLKPVAETTRKEKRRPVTPQRPKKSGLWQKVQKWTEQQQKASPGAKRRKTKK